MLTETDERITKDVEAKQMNNLRRRTLVLRKRETQKVGRILGNLRSEWLHHLLVYSVEVFETKLV